MFVPLYDVNALKHIKLQYVTLSLIAINIAVWLITGLAGSDEFSGRAAMGLGYIPALIFDGRYLDPSLYLIDEDWTYLTYAFLHGDVWHLAGNMLFLWVFGDNVEDAMGHLRFLAFFLICGAAASLTHAFIDPASHRPLIGASGGVSGVVAAYLILYPRVRIWGLFLKGIPLRLPAYWAIGFWFVLQFISAFFGADDGVGWFAHLGGFVVGAILTPLMRHRYDPVLARAQAQELQAPR